MNALPVGAMYRWLVFDTTDANDVKIIFDLISPASTMSFNSGDVHRNLDVVVVAADDQFSIDSQGFVSSIGGGYQFFIPRGRYEWDYDYVYVRDPSGSKPPESLLSIVGSVIEHTTYEDDYIYHDITLAEGESLVFDGSASSDPDGDELQFYWEVYRPGTFGQIEDSQTTDVLSYSPGLEVSEFGQTIVFCVDDGVAWHSGENPCHWIDIVIAE